MNFGKKSELPKFSELKITLDNEHLAITETTKYLGMWLDSTLSFECHVNDVCKRAAMALGTIGRIKRLLPKTTRATLVNAVVTPIFDYGAVVYRNISVAATERLQQMQNRSAKLILGVKNNFPSDEALKQLSWLPLNQRRDVQFATETFKAVRLLGPKSISELLVRKEKIHSHRTRGELHKTGVNSRYGLESFTFQSAKLWEKLPANLKNARNLSSFKSELLKSLPLDYR
jgi:hypothetical protein